MGAVFGSWVGGDVVVVSRSGGGGDERHSSISRGRETAGTEGFVGWIAARLVVIGGAAVNFGTTGRAGAGEGGVGSLCGGLEAHC
jgi:hypothetical protein